MKNVMYFYNDIQSEEELHDDEVVANLVEGQMMERAGENWKIVQVETVTVASSNRATPGWQRHEVLDVLHSGWKTVTALFLPETSHLLFLRLRPSDGPPRMMLLR